MNALETRKAIQSLLNVTADGRIGPKTLQALNALVQAPDDQEWPLRAKEEASELPEPPFTYRGGMSIDCDGSPHAYHPDDKSGLDALANGGPKDDPYGYLLNPATKKPYIQGQDAPAFDDSSKGFYVSATTYERKEFPANDPRRYLNSETERFIVVPSKFRREAKGAVLGCKATVEYKGNVIETVVGDIGPRFGEASIAVARGLGINASGRHGGTDDGVTYRIYPGIAAEGYELHPA